MDDLLTVDELGALLRVPPSWIYSRTCPQSAKEDRLPFLRLGRLLRFRRAEIETWVERHHFGEKSLGSEPNDHAQAIEKAQLN